MSVQLSKIEPYLTAFSAAISLVLLGLIVNLMRAYRENYQDQFAFLKDKIESEKDEKKKTEVWAERDKQYLKDELERIKLEFDALLKKEGLDLLGLTIGRRLSESADKIQVTADELIKKIADRISDLSKISSESDVSLDPSFQLSLAMGAMAQGQMAQAAAQFDEYAKMGSLSWEASFARGVAHANSRGGAESDLESLRAYNDAIALAPADLESNRKARLFSYRGAMLKRLHRLAESRSDLELALSFANSQIELSDIHYNLACIFALTGDKEKMIGELSKITKDRKKMNGVRFHINDYFKNFRDDADFLKFIRD